MLTARGQSKPKIFISYSRKNLAFADQLEAALKARGFDTLIDRTEIYALEDWWKRVEALIAQSDTVVFVLSPDSVASTICQREVTFATSLNKRLAPIVHRRVEDKAVPVELTRLNFIFFDDSTRFDENIQHLNEALETDIGWVRQHTEIGEHARRWSAAGRPGPRGLLLRSPLLEEAEHWIASRPEGAPSPTEATQAFITESRRAASQRRNILSGSLGAGLLVALGLAGLTYWQRGIAIEQRDKALLTQSRFLADLAKQQTAKGDAATAILLAAEALPDISANSAPRPYAPEAEFALDEAWRAVRERTVLASQVSLWSAAFSPDGNRIVTASGDQTARIWDAATGAAIGAPLRGHKGDVFSAAFSPDGKSIVTASADGTARIWDATTGVLIHLLTGHKGGVHSAVFSPDGKRIVTASNDKTVRLWDPDTGKPIGQPLIGHTSDVTRAVFSPDGKRIVSTSFDMTARQWDAETGKPVGAPLIGHESIVSGAAFSPDGKRIATVSEDGMVRLWDTETGIPISAPVKIYDGRLLGVEYSPDGKRIVVVSTENTARLWNVRRSTHELLTLAKAYVSRCLTRAQRSAAFLDPEPPIWCIEMGKWPYETDDWKAWLKYKRGSLKPPLPDTTEWRPWVAANPVS